MGRDTNSGIIVFACGMIGVILAMIEKTLYDKGVLFDEFITGSINNWEVMAVIIIIWLLIGTVIAVARS